MLLHTNIVVFMVSSQGVVKTEIILSFGGKLQKDQIHVKEETINFYVLQVLLVPCSGIFFGFLTLGLEHERAGCYTWAV
jgi:hypothetical protein